MSSIELDLAAASAGELVDAVAVIAAELAARRPPESAAACMELTEILAGAVDRSERALAGFIGVVDTSGEMRRWGLPSAQAWLRSRLGMREAHARERLRLARQLPRLPKVDELLATGELSLGYATTIADAAIRLDEQDRHKAEEILLGFVDQGFSAGKVASFGHKIGELIAERDGTEAPPEEAKRGYERSWLDATRSLDGGRYLKGWLNREDAAAFEGALAALAKPAGHDDRRDLSERTAAALTSVLSGGHRATKVTVIVDLDTLTGGNAPARLPDGSPIPAEQARRLAVAAGVSPLLLGNKGVPLYLGKRVRFASPGQRRVLETLYPTCAVQGCEVPGTLCEVDHVDGWALGCPTDIDRLALTCGWHNRFKATDPEQIQIGRGEDGRYAYHVLPPKDSRRTPGRWDTRPNGIGHAAPQPDGQAVWSRETQRNHQCRYTGRTGDKSQAPGAVTGRDDRRPRLRRRSDQGQRQPKGP